MKKYEKLIYIILAVILFLTILIMLLIHTFNHTNVDGMEITSTTKEIKDYIRGD